MNTAESTARAIISVVNLLFSKVFLRAIALFVVLIFVSSYFPWTDTFFSGIFPNPELRIRYDPSRENHLNTDLTLDDEWWFQRAILVENQGNSPADTVYISTSVPWGKITRYSIYSEYPYKIADDTRIDEGYLLIELEKLPPDAKLRLYVQGSQTKNTGNKSEISKQADVVFSAVHAAGAAPVGPEPSSSEQIKLSTDQILSSLRESSLFIRTNPKLASPATTLQLGQINVVLPSVPPFLGISAIALALISWLFLDSAKSSILNGILVAGIYWLRVDNFFLPPILMIYSSIIGFIILTINEGALSLFSRLWSLVVKRDMSPFSLSFERRSQLIFILSTILLVIGFALNNGVGSTTHQLASYYTIAYIVTILSLLIP